MNQRKVFSCNIGKMAFMLRDRARTVLITVLMAWSSVIAWPARAMEVNLIGLFPGKAVISLNDGKVKIFAIGQFVSEYIKLLEANSERAIFEINGRREILTLSKHISSFSPQAVGSSQIAMRSDASGTFRGDGMINGHPLTFLLDTGAELVTFPVSIARSLGLPYHRGEPAIAVTVGGTLPAYKVRLASVQLDMLLERDVEALVVDAPAFNAVLLGMSFLKRVNMKREGEHMTFTKRSSH